MYVYNAAGHAVSQLVQAILVPVDKASYGQKVEGAVVQCVSLQIQSGTKNLLNPYMNLEALGRVRVANFSGICCLTLHTGLSYLQVPRRHASVQLL